MSYSFHLYVKDTNTSESWFNGPQGVTAESILVGMMTNFIFGFIDNCGLFFGGSFLDEVFELLPGGDDGNVCAG